MARLPIDILQYVEARLAKMLSASNGKVNTAVLQPELEAFYDLWFIVTNGELAAEAMFSRINEAASSVVDAAHFARYAAAERAAIYEEIKTVNSNADSSARKRRGL